MTDLHQNKQIVREFYELAFKFGGVRRVGR